MTLYADTSALAKLIVTERESPTLRSWIRDSARGPLVTNVVGAVELRRVAVRFGSEALGAATTLLGRVGQIGLTPACLALAAMLPPPQVRTLDALHVASAAQLADLGALITYDARMADAATAYGLPVVSPGR